MDPYQASVLRRMMRKFMWTENDCLEWTGGKNRGYGAVRVGSRTDNSLRQVSAHRFAYEMIVGPIPDGLTIDHLCRNKACWNWLHLEPVTNRENCNRHHSLKTTCPQGHLYDYVGPRGWRGCKECRNKSSRDAKRVKAAERRKEVHHGST